MRCNNHSKILKIRSGMKRNVVVCIKIAVILLIFYFIGDFIKDNVYELQSIKLHFNHTYLLFSIVFLISSIFNFALIWQFITIKNNCQIPLEKGIIAWFYSELGKYIPGKFFLLAGKIYYYKQEGMSAKRISFCFFLETVCTLLAASFIFVISLIFIKNAALETYKYYIYLLILLFVICLHPRIIETPVNIIMKMLNKEKVYILVSYLDILEITGLYVVNFLLLGVSLYFLVSSLYEIKISNFFFLTGSYSLAFLLGIISLFAPSGIGVREGVLILALKHIMPNSIAGIISLVSRVWMTGTELLLIALVFVYAKARGIEFKRC